MSFEPQDRSRSRSRPPLFVWLEALACASARGQVKQRVVELGVLAAIESRGTSGEDVTVPASTAVKLGQSERQMRRHLADLVAAGWLVRTSAGTRGRAGQAGRLARYRLTVPSVDVSSDSADEMTPPHEEVSPEPQELMTPPHEEVSCDSAEDQMPDEGAAVSYDSQNHMTLSTTSDDTEHAQSRHCLPYQCSPSIHLPASSDESDPPAAADMDAPEPEPNGVRAAHPIGTPSMSHAWRPNQWGDACLDCGEGHLHRLHLRHQAAS